MATPDIKRAFRGVDPTQVDEVFRALAQQISSIEQAIAERNRTSDRLKKDIADPASALPSYSKLGSAFEQTLRTAEEQARRLRNDAAVTVSEIGNSTDIDVHNLTQKTERENRNLIDAASALAKDLRLQIERETAAETQQLEDERARMETNAARADRTAASLISQAEQQLSDVRAAALHDEADAFAQQAYERADAHVDGVIAQSEALKQEADDYLLSAQIRADQILQDSRGLVQKSISDAMTLSSQITLASDEFFADFVLDAESSIGQIRRNDLALSNYTAHIRGVSHDVNVDAIEAGPARGLRSIQQAQIVEDEK